VEHTPLTYPPFGRIYCGFDNAIRVFDTLVPGHDFELLATTPTRRSKLGQKGLISCLTFNPDRSGLYAAGSFSKTIGLYDEKQSEVLFILKGHTGGVTNVGLSFLLVLLKAELTTIPRLQLKFSPDGYHLYSGARHDSKIYCWDVRNTGGILFELERPLSNNQRLSFDLDPSGRYLVTGNEEGHVTVFDLQEPESNPPTRLVRQYNSLHGDTITSAAFHPFRPLLVTCSGQRKFPVVSDDSSDSTGTDSDSDSSGSSPSDEEMPAATRRPDFSDNSLRVWKMGCTWVSADAVPQQIQSSVEDPECKS